jgi:hypothetical protein
MHLSTSSVPIPSHLLQKSKMLMDVLSACDTSVTKEFTLAAPTEWLEAWAACFSNREKSLGGADSEFLVNCLMVRKVS